jgi:hypothetical protein
LTLLRQFSLIFHRIKRLKQISSSYSEFGILGLLHIKVYKGVGRKGNGLLIGESQWQKNRKNMVACLSKRCIVASILLLSVFAISLSLGLDSSGPQNNTDSFTNSAVTAVPANISNQATGDSTANIKNTSIAESPSLKCIWSVFGIEKDRIVIALNQEGNDLFGQAKYEPDNGTPWNGVVAGFVSGNRVHLAIAALKGKEKVSTVLDGIFSDETINGKFFNSSDGEISGSGEFSATCINPDLSSYTPANVKVVNPELPATATNSSAPPVAGLTSQQTGLQKSRFHDVHLDADRIQTGVGDISQIPIGMG